MAILIPFNLADLTDEERAALREPGSVSIMPVPAGVRLNPRELATVLAALRCWQGEGQASPSGVEGLTDIEIDALCERLNVKPTPSIASYEEAAEVPKAAWDAPSVEPAASFKECPHEMSPYADLPADYGWRGVDTTDERGHCKKCGAAVPF